MNVSKGSKKITQKQWLVGLAFLVLALAACSKNPVPEAKGDIHEETFISETLDSTDVVEAREDAVVATLKLENGNVIHFINESSAGEKPRIGVVEITEVGQASRLASFEDIAPTPLELFLAFSGSDAPAALVEDHARKALINKASLEPRKLQLAKASGELSAQAVQVKNCWGLTPAGYHLNFRAAETLAFGALLAHHGHGQNLLSTHYGVTGFATRRALGTCNVNGYVKSVRVEYQWTSNLWVNVPLGVTWLFPGQSLFYYSSSWPVSYKYRIKVGFTVNGLAGNSVHTEGSWQ
jgi:hypothetical protein